MTLHILFKCVSVDSLVVFHDRNRRTPDDTLKRLQEFGDFAFSRTIKTFMQGSGERKTAWLFYRDQLNFCCTVTSDSSPCAFLVFAYLIGFVSVTSDSWHSLRCRRLCDSARTLLGTGQCRGHSPLCPATPFRCKSLVSLARPLLATCWRQGLSGSVSVDSATFKSEVE